MSPNFADDFNMIRKNIKDINLIFNSNAKSSADLDMRVLAGLNLYFSSFNNNVDINLKYVNNENYGGNNFMFDRYCNVAFIPIPDSAATNTLIIDSINATDSSINFYLNNGKKTNLYFSSLLIKAEVLKNVTSLYKRGTGFTYFKVQEDDVIAVAFGTKENSMNFQGNKVVFNYMKEDNFMFEGAPNFAPDSSGSIKVTINPEVDSTTLPDLSFMNLNELEFVGKLWKPNDTNPLKNLTRIKRIIAPPGDFPFSIFSDRVTLKISGNTTVYGRVDSDQWALGRCVMAIESDMKQLSTVDFKGYFDGVANIMSPYLNLNFDNFAINYTFTQIRSFPVSFSFNEFHISRVSIKNITYNTRELERDTFVFYPTITKEYTDEEIKELPVFKDGFNFLELPLNTLSNYRYTTLIDRDSPSAKKVIPGFTPDNTCFSLMHEIDTTFKLKGIVSKLAYDSPAYICITEGIQKCESPIRGKYPFRDITSVPGGDISSFFSNGYKQVFIATTIVDRLITLDLDRLSRNLYNVTIVGQYIYDIRSQFSIKASYGKVDNLSLNYIVLPGSMDFNVNYLSMRGVVFTKGMKYDFKNAIVTTDTKAIDSLNNVSLTIKINELSLLHHRDYFDNSEYLFSTFDESIDIDNDIMSICIHGRSTRRVTESYCASFDSRNYNKFSMMSSNNLVITSRSMTDTFRPVNITFDSIFKWRAFTISLFGDGFSTKLQNKFMINNYQPGLRVIVSKPGQADNFMIYGTGSYLFQVMYGRRQNYCVFTDGAKESCHSYPYNTIQINNTENVQEELAMIDNVSSQITFDYVDYPIYFSNSFFDSKEVILKTYDWKDSLQKIGINFTGRKIDRFYSSTYFDSVNLTYDGTTDQTAYFGQLRFGYEFDTDPNFRKHVSIYASQLVANYKNLYNFKSIEIDDQLNLTGDVPTDGGEISIKFVPDQDANDLVAQLKGNVTIKITKNTLMVGKITYILSHSDNYDAYFYLSNDANIIIDCDVSVTQNDFVKFVLDCRARNCDIKFTGTYPKLNDDEESLIRIFNANKLNVDVITDLPISIASCIDVNLHLKANNVKRIQGPIDFKERSGFSVPQIKIYNDVNQRNIVEIVNGIFIDRSLVTKSIKLIALMSANLEVKINKFGIDRRSLDFSIETYHTIDNTGSSKIIFANTLPQIISLSNKSFVYTKVIGKIPNEDEFPFIKTNETLIEANSENLEQLTFSFEYIYDSKDDIAHGFLPTANSLAVQTTGLNTGRGSVQLYSYVKPSSIPFVIDIVNTGSDPTDGELIIDDSKFDTLKNLKSMLPFKYSKMIIRLYRSLSSSYPLNFNLLLNSNQVLDINIQSMERLGSEAYVHLPTSNQLSLKFENLILRFITSGSSDIVASSLNFTDCKFMNAQDIRITEKVGSLMMDVDSLNGLANIAMLTYPNKMIVDSANVVLFTKDGWMFKEDRSKSSTLIKASNYPNIEFETNKFCLLMINESDLTEIQSFKFNSYPQSDGEAYFEMSANWGKIKNLNNFLINVNGARRVNLNSASYPIPKIFNISNSLISYTFETDVHGNFDVITLYDGFIFRDEVFMADFTFLPSQFQYVKGKRATFSGNTQISFKNDVGNVQLDDAIFNQSNSSFSNLEILKNMDIGKRSRIYGTYRFGPASKVKLHWTLSEAPLIIHQRKGSGAPQTIEIIYDDTKVDTGLFKKTMIESNGLILMRGDFECYKMINNIKYGGDFKLFGDGNQYLKFDCDTSSDGQVMLMKGTREISPDDYDDADSASKNSKLSTGSVAGIVIGCAIAVALVVAFAVYYIQRKKIDKLKNEIPVESNSAYMESRTETMEESHSVF